MLLQLLGSGDGVVVLVLLALLVFGGGVVAWQRAWSQLALCLAFAAGHVVTFHLTFSANPFAIFAPGYLVGICVSPVVFAIVVGWQWGLRRAVGGSLWGLAVGGLHLFVVAIASASV